MGEGTTPKGQRSPGRVEKLIDLVAYADGAVVSRILTGNSAGNVTLFAFDIEQVLSEHMTPYDALVQVLDGEGEFTIGGVAHRVRAGEIVWMPAGVPHAVRAVTPFKMLLTMIKGER